MDEVDKIFNGHQLIYIVIHMSYLFAVNVQRICIEILFIVFISFLNN